MKTMIAIPCMDKIDTPFVQSLLQMPKPDCEVAFAVSSLIYDARNILAEKAVNDGYDAVLWLDSDMVFQPDLLERLSVHLKEHEFVTGVYSTRKPQYVPCVYSDITPGKPATPVIDLPKEPFEIMGCGFGAVLMSTSLIKDIGEQYGRPFSPASGLGEDLSFCARATYLGHKLICDPSVRLGHVGSFIFEVSE